MLDEDPSGSVILEQRGLKLRQEGHLEASERSWQETVRSEVGQWEWGRETTKPESG